MSTAGHLENGVETEGSGGTVVRYSFRRYLVKPLLG
jgi:hypothetical protein